MSENSIPLPAGRKSAFAARNRAKLISATQIALAEEGPNVTIEEIANRADMAVSTIYKHFPNREQLVEKAIVSGMQEWEAWAAQQTTSEKGSLESLVNPMRLFILMNQTHPVFAQMAIKSERELEHLLPELTNGLRQHIESLLSAKTLRFDDLDARFQNLCACLYSAFKTSVIQNDQTLALAQVRTALGLLEINPEDYARLLLA